MLWASVALKAANWLLGFANKQADRQLEKHRIDAGVTVEQIRAKTELVRAGQAVIAAGMQFPIFWIPWAIATIPASMWFGWGMLDTLTNGLLPDVAEVPPGLAPYMDQLWDNLFLQYATGGAVAGAQTVANAIIRRK